MGLVGDFVALPEPVPGGTSLGRRFGSPCLVHGVGRMFRLLRRLCIMHGHCDGLAVTRYYELHIRCQVIPVRSLLLMEDIGLAAV